MKNWRTTIVGALLATVIAVQPILSTGQIVIPNPYFPSKPSIFKDFHTEGYGWTDMYKGIAQSVDETEIPGEYRAAFLEAKSEIEIEHIEEDLEAERVNALYVMTHYLHANGNQAAAWWLPRSGNGSPLIDSLVREYWDKGPFARIERWVATAPKAEISCSLVELGCGVGGLYSRLRQNITSYLGVDSSFAGIALGRHLALGMPYRGVIRFPEDLLLGTVSREVKIPVSPFCDGNGDLVVGDAENPPVVRGVWDITVALNIIDMLNEPKILPELQKNLLKENGSAIQSSPYIWHSEIARELREILPKDIRESHRAVEWLYEKADFKIQERLEHVPWLFFKHVRQLEIYSAHMFIAKKASPSTAVFTNFRL